MVGKSVYQIIEEPEDATSHLSRDDSVWSCHSHSVGNTVSLGRP